MESISPENDLNIKPFLKWAGGKTQLLPEILNSVPKELIQVKSFHYIEPFVGSGAVLFNLLKHFNNLRSATINDINPDLAEVYRIAKGNLKLLISELSRLEKQYFLKEDNEYRKEVFYESRELFNSQKLNAVKKSALLIFLNRTCFNGLYRVNSRGKFNVPFGKYKNPKICDKEKLTAVSQALQKVTILNLDFEATLEFAEKNSFFYLDPPYKPISKTASFTAYSQETFDDRQQERLKDFCDLLDKKGHLFMLSNSDPKNHDTDADFFDKLYASFNIRRVKARRIINSVGAKRGHIHELMITNY